MKIQHRGGATKDLVAAYVDLDEREELFTLARLQDRSVSAVVRRALRAELDRSRMKP